MPKIVGYMLMITGIWIMAAVIYYRIKGKQRNVAEPGIMRALAVGIAQGIAIVPGISRSGATIATGMLSGMRREEAFKFSFLLAIPAIAGACIFKARKIQLCLAASETACFSAGAVTAMIAGIISLKVLSKAVRGDKLYLFGIYCFFAGIVTIILS
jgi:undecaprenyl-diphosphatase